MPGRAGVLQRGVGITHPQTGLCVSPGTGGLSLWASHPTPPTPPQTVGKLAWGCVCTRFPRPRPPVTSRLPPPVLRHRGRMLLGSGNGADKPAGARWMARAIFGSPVLRPRPWGMPTRFCIRTLSRLRRASRRTGMLGTLPEAASKPGSPLSRGDARAGRGRCVASADLLASGAARRRRKGPDGRFSVWLVSFHFRNILPLYRED